MSTYLVAEDGVTHINVYSAAKTTIGKLLSNFTKVPTYSEHYKITFASCEGLYHYHKLYRACADAELSPDTITEMGLTELIPLYGYRAQKLGRQLRERVIKAGVYIEDIPNELFVSVMEDGIEHKLKWLSINFPDTYAEILANELPYVHYYNFNGKVIHKKHFDWLPERIQAVIDKINHE